MVLHLNWGLSRRKETHVSWGVAAKLPDAAVEFLECRKAGIW